MNIKHHILFLLSALCVANPGSAAPIIIEDFEDDTGYSVTGGSSTSGDFFQRLAWSEDKGVNLDAVSGFAFQGRDIDDGAAGPWTVTTDAFTGFTNGVSYFISIDLFHINNPLESADQIQVSYSLDGNTTFTPLLTVAGDGTSFPGLGSGPTTYTSPSTFVASGTSLQIRVEALGFTDGGSNSERFAFDNIAIAIPEPSTLALVGIALGSVALFRRRKA
jgi:hypothetical protein